MGGLDAHVGAGEERGGERHECRECHEEHVERIDEELLAPEKQVAVADHARGERAGGQEGPETERCVDLGSIPARTEEPEERCAGDRQTEQKEELHASSAP